MSQIKISISCPIPVTQKYLQCYGGKSVQKALTQNMNSKVSLLLMSVKDCQNNDREFMLTRVTYGGKQWWVLLEYNQHTILWVETLNSDLHHGLILQPNQVYALYLIMKNNISEIKKIASFKDFSKAATNIFHLQDGESLSKSVQNRVAYFIEYQKHCFVLAEQRENGIYNDGTIQDCFVPLLPKNHYFYPMVAKVEKDLRIIQYQSPVKDIPNPILNIDRIQEYLEDRIFKKYNCAKSEKENSWRDILYPTYQLFIGSCEQYRNSFDIFNSMIVLYIFANQVSKIKSWIRPEHQKISLDLQLCQELEKFINGYTFSIIDLINQYEVLQNWWRAVLTHIYDSGDQRYRIDTGAALNITDNGWDNPSLVSVLNGDDSHYSKWKKVNETQLCSMMRLDFLIHNNNLIPAYHLASAVGLVSEYVDIMIKNKKFRDVTNALLKFDNLKVDQLYEIAKKLHKYHSREAFFIILQALRKTRKIRSKIAALGNSPTKLRKITLEGSYGKQYKAAIMGQWIVDNYLLSSDYESCPDVIEKIRTDKASIEQLYKSFKTNKAIYHPLSLYFLQKYISHSHLGSVATQLFTAEKFEDAYILYFYLYENNFLLNPSQMDRWFQTSMRLNRVPELLSQIVEISKRSSSNNIRAYIPFTWVENILKSNIQLAFGLGMIILRHPRAEHDDNIPIRWFLKEVCCRFVKDGDIKVLNEIQQTVAIRLPSAGILQCVDYIMIEKQNSNIAFQFLVGFIKHHGQRINASHGSFSYKAQTHIKQEILLKLFDVSRHLGMEKFSYCTKEYLNPSKCRRYMMKGTLSFDKDANVLISHFQQNGNAQHVHLLADQWLNHQCQKIEDLQEQNVYTTITEKVMICEILLDFYHKSKESNFNVDRKMAEKIHLALFKEQPTEVNYEKTKYFYKENETEWMSQLTDLFTYITKRPYDVSMRLEIVKILLKESKLDLALSYEKKFSPPVNPNKAPNSWNRNYFGDVFFVIMDHFLVKDKDLALKPSMIDRILTLIISVTWYRTGRTAYDQSAIHSLKNLDSIVTQLIAEVDGQQNSLQKKLELFKETIFYIQQIRKIQNVSNDRSLLGLLQNMKKCFGKLKEGRSFARQYKLWKIQGIGGKKWDIFDDQLKA